MKSFIFLVGMPGSGKSTIGKLLAQTLAVPFYDLDEAIEKKAHLSVSELFEQSGEDYFRQVESEVLKDLVLNQEPGIMATGGGSPCFHDGMVWMNGIGVTVFLDVTLTELVERNSHSDHRPLLNHSLEEKLLDLYNVRRPIYLTAAHTIKCQGADQQKITSEVIEHLGLIL